MCEDEVYKSLWSAEDLGLCVTFFFFLNDDRVLVSVIFFHIFSLVDRERRRYSWELKTS